MNNNGSILVVEDSPTQAERLRHLLEMHCGDFAIETAGNGREALEVVAARRPRLIISDIVMPVMDGYEMCSALKQREELRSIPVILLTSLSDPEDIIRGLNAGTDYYLTKPYEDGFLVERVKAILAHPQGPRGGGDAGWRIMFAGREHVVHADLQQMLNLLLSTYENAVQQNRKLMAVQEELRRTNERLEERVEERTRALSETNAKLRVEVSERSRAEQRLQLQLKRLDALRHIDAAITGSLDLRLTLNVLLDQVTNQLQVDAAAVLLQKHATHRLEFAAGRGFRHRPGGNAGFDYGKGPAGRAARERAMVRLYDLSTHTGTLDRRMLEQEGFTSYIALPLIAKGKAEGVLEIYNRSPLEPDSEWMDFLEALGGQAAVAIDSALLFADLQRSNSELFDAYETTLEGWSKALDLRDKETEGHSLRVTGMTECIGERLGLDDAALINIRRGALLHDIGKLGVPDHILRKPGPLSGEERKIIEQHTTYAYEMLAPIRFLQPAIDIPHAHHERWDGQGYPRGLKGEQIPLAARIFAVADVWDALRSDRPYRKAWPRRRCLEHILDLSGSHFDPRVVAAFLALYEELGEDIDNLPEPEACVVAPTGREVDAQAH